MLNSNIAAGPELYGNTHINTGANNDNSSNQPSYDNQPDTPLHPKGNEELPSTFFRKNSDLAKESLELHLNMDLNPDLSDDDEDNEEDNNISKTINENIGRGSYHHNHNDHIIPAKNKFYNNCSRVQFSIGNDNDDENEIDIDLDTDSANIVSNGFSNYISSDVDMDLDYQTSESELSDFKPSKSFVNNNHTLHNTHQNKKNYLDISVHQTINKKKLTNKQHSKLIMYIDTELINVQKKYVQSFNDDEDNTTTSNNNRPPAYKELIELLDDLIKLVRFIEYSIKETTFNYGYQTQYLIKISGDLLDYLHFNNKFKFNKKTLLKLIQLIQLIDLNFVLLIDSHNSLSNTDKVRLCTITERSRLSVISLTGKFNVNDYKYEVSKLYENVLERIT
ncbi:TFIIH complex subunit TFB6 ASCRUDRAFT_9084 [Ascoidea rubescens DSM 1968]|uniref:Uncharacterized protein n=1 Tax=Ascoidea rubescens DSM 1968 TaxID=1344418 RepID=A0A1D2VEI3_9ASCO|nr:hypothetical protein ASCRUDRAFT_9084 [Ascoidea rubescens DSM 1968]ODV59877.1 hypothetical protein ASCRUDRAFT_9084 [Ascoidea rubescens DSM 1968]